MNTQRFLLRSLHACPILKQGVTLLEMVAQEECNVKNGWKKRAPETQQRGFLPFQKLLLLRFWCLCVDTVTSDKAAGY